LKSYKELPLTADFPIGLIKKNKEIPLFYFSNVWFYALKTNDLKLKCLRINKILTKV